MLRAVPAYEPPIPPKPGDWPLAIAIGSAQFEPTRKDGYAPTAHTSHDISKKIAVHEKKGRVTSVEIAST